MSKPNWFTRIRDSKKGETHTLCAEAERHDFCAKCGCLLCIECSPASEPCPEEEEED